MPSLPKPEKIEDFQPSTERIIKGPHDVDFAAPHRQGEERRSAEAKAVAAEDWGYGGAGVTVRLPKSNPVTPELVAKPEPVSRYWMGHEDSYPYPAPKPNPKPHIYERIANLLGLPPKPPQPSQ